MATRTPPGKKKAPAKKATKAKATKAKAPKATRPRGDERARREGAGPGPARAFTGGGRTLVIVESPTKARTIRAFLPAGYRVEASMGHVRDLPGDAKEIPAKYKALDWSRLGVNVDNDFEPLYIVPSDKKAIVRELKDALAESDQLILATDEDREGESISWHLHELLQPKVPVKRMVFHEITKEAIQDALEHTRDVDDRLVRAQETRRILDRLVGYTLSPLLWKKIAWGLSAGRVQSVAMRLLVVRERERRAFRAGTYWDLVAQLRHAGQGIQGGAEPGGREEGRHRPRLRRVHRQAHSRPRRGAARREKDAGELRTRLLKSKWTVTGTEEKPSIRRPWAPFTTSTLQQEANRKLRLSARDTMRTAQSLYERGFITYMRTDSVHLSDQAISAARNAVHGLYGKEYLPAEPRRYSNKSANAQEAHEAIRPAGAFFKLPSEAGLDGRELALYDLIWKRTVASQMADARQTGIAATIEAADAVFRATGKRIDFPGFLRAYVEGSDDPEAALEDQEIILPAAQGRRHADLRGARGAVARDAAAGALHRSDAGEGARGRRRRAPSTYASVIGTILERGYAQRQGQALVPTFTAFAVTALLEEHFPHLVDEKFTARMEETLDEISEGHAEWLPYLREFYLGDEGLQAAGAAARKADRPDRRAHRGPGRARRDREDREVRARTWRCSATARA